PTIPQRLGQVSRSKPRVQEVDYHGNLRIILPQETFTVLIKRESITKYFCEISIIEERNDKRHQEQKEEDNPADGARPYQRINLF
ncbi:MAG: hypothetical protein EZS28_039434, partial [Streblomastix strix]